MCACMFKDFLLNYLLLYPKQEKTIRSSQNICRGKSGLPLNANQLLSSVIFEEFMRVIKFIEIEGR
jgi:hypothetical protein